MTHSLDGEVASEIHPLADPAPLSPAVALEPAEGTESMEADPPESAAPAALVVLADAVRGLEEALAESRRVQEHQRTLLDQLHEERQELREAEHRRLRDPVVRELIQLSDTCLRTSRQWLGRADVAVETAQAVHRVLQDTADDIQLTLERQGVEAFAPRPDDPFDRAACKAVGAQPTPEPERDGRVVEVRRRGYRMGERVVRFCEVVVWRETPAN